MSASESAMNSVSPRQQQILALARQSGNVTVDDLALRFDVTPQTIRKDLNELCDGRFLARTHGGAILSSGVENLAYEARLHMAAAEKIVIGKKAASLIPDNCSLFINIGTTTEEVARALVNHQGLLVITNNIHVATILMPRPGIEVIVAGGMLRKSDRGIVGEAASEFISQFKVDHAVIGASALDEDGAMLDFDYHEVRVAKAILQNLSIKRYVSFFNYSYYNTLYCMQLIRPENLRQLSRSDNSKDSDENNLVVCLNEIKMGVLAKAVVYPGVNTFIMNLITSFSEDAFLQPEGLDSFGTDASREADDALFGGGDESGKHGQTHKPWLTEYQKGCDWEIYTTSLSDIFVG
eukprot:gene45797-57071_t